MSPLKLISNVCPWLQGIFKHLNFHINQTQNITTNLVSHVCLPDKCQSNINFVLWFGLHHLLRGISVSLAAQCFTFFTSYETEPNSNCNVKTK